MGYSRRARFDTLRSLAFGSVAASYTQVGSVTADVNVLIKITNYTDQPVFFSTDGVNDMDFIPEKGFVLYDITTNKASEDGLFLPGNTGLFIKRAVGAPTVGSVFITIIHTTAG